MSNLFKKLFFQGDTWKIAYRVTKSDILNDKTTPFSILKLPKGFWGADPFLFEKDGVVYVFFELTDYKKRKSVLACKELFNNNCKINVIYEFPYHCSYPCIFPHKNDVYIIPETVQNRNVILLKCRDFPLKWEYKKTLFSEYNSVDSTPAYLNNHLFLFTYDIFNNGSYDTKIYRIDDALNPEIKPIHSTSSTSNIYRPAGSVIKISNNEYVRPVQPSNNYYGEKIVFLMGNLKWEEAEIASVTIKDIVLKEKKLKKYIGLHTYNKLGSIEIIDIAEMSFRPFKIIAYIFRKLNLFGYGLYDKSGKFISQKLNQKYFNKPYD